MEVNKEEPTFVELRMHMWNVDFDGRLENGQGSYPYAPTVHLQLRSLTIRTRVNERESNKHDRESWLRGLGGTAVLETHRLVSLTVWRTLSLFSRT